MSDNPNTLKRTLLEDASTDTQREFAKMLAEQCAVADVQKDHRCWTFIPTPTEYDRMRQYQDGCPKCKKGRCILEFFHGNLGESVNVVCRWGEPWCDFKEYVSDDD
jgi:hypothetical protein